VYIQQMQEKAAAEAQELADKKEKKRLTDEANELQKKVNEANQELIKAQEAYKKALEEFNANFAKNTLNAAYDKQSQMYGGMWGHNATRNDGSNPIQDAVQQAANFATDQQIKQGMFNSVKEVAAAQRSNLHEARNLNNKLQNQFLRDEKTARDLYNKNKKLWNDSDKQWMENYKKLRNQQQKDGKNLKDAKDALEAAQASQKSADENIADIATKVAAISEKLGLK